MRGAIEEMSVEGGVGVKRVRRDWRKGGGGPGGVLGGAAAGWEGEGIVAGE